MTEKLTDIDPSAVEIINGLDTTMRKHVRRQRIDAVMGGLAVCGRTWIANMLFHSPYMSRDGQASPEQS